MGRRAEKYWTSKGGCDKVRTQFQRLIRARLYPFRVTGKKEVTRKSDRIGQVSDN